jgi:FkbM family methyltransferase
MVKETEWLMRQRLRRLLDRPLGTPHRRPHVSWSQFGEDIIIQRYLGNGPGHYIDVGAGDPIVGSNTYQLYRLGWRGILIEPIGRLAERCRKVRRHDQVLEALCGDSTGTAALSEFEPWQLSTACAARAEALVSAGHKRVSVKELPVVNLAELNVNIEPGGPSLLSVDVEGRDLDVLQGNDWTRYRPTLICVEEDLGSCTEPSPVGDLLRKLGYRRMSRTVVSSFYVHEDSGGGYALPRR